VIAAFAPTRLSMNAWFWQRLGSVNTRRLREDYRGKAAAGCRTCANRTGALSAISISAIWPSAPAPNIYQAGAMALPVTWISQVTTSCVVPPKAAIETE
jgi:hypothetical protein